MNSVPPESPTCLSSACTLWECNLPFMARPRILLGASIRGIMHQTSAQDLEKRCQNRAAAQVQVASLPLTSSTCSGRLWIATLSGVVGRIGVHDEVISDSLLACELCFCRCVDISSGLLWP